MAFFACMRNKLSVCKSGAETVLATLAHSYQAAGLTLSKYLSNLLKYQNK